MALQGLPVILGLVSTLVGYALAAKRIKKVSEILLFENKVKTKNLMWYPIALFVMFIPSLIIGFIEINYEESISTWVKAIQLILLESMGVVNALVYGLQRKVYKSRTREFSGGLIQL